MPQKGLDNQYIAPNEPYKEQKCLINLWSIIFQPKKLFAPLIVCCIYLRATFQSDIKNAAKRSRQHARIQRRSSSNERTYTRGVRTHNVTN